jgi:hypothetical protein
MKTSIFIIILFFSLHVYSQNFATVKNGQLKTEIWIPEISLGNGAKENEYLKNQIHLSFIERINDTVVVVFNKRIIFNAYVNTSDTHSNEDIILEMDPNTKTSELTITLLNRKECRLAYITNEYKNIEVYKYRRWELRYINY